MIIAHYEHDIWARGGLATYIYRISQAQREAGHKVYHFSRELSTPPEGFEAPALVDSDEDLFRQAIALKVDVLHLHRSIRQIPPKQLPTLLTLHEHTPYCPSGGRYLKRQGCPCDRAYSLHGCLWGHFVDRCGSVRPHRLKASFQTTWHEREFLSHIPVITVSQFLKDQMVRSGYKADSIHVLHLFSPQEIQENQPPPMDSSRFVFLGRIVPHKGLEWLIRSFAKVSSDCYLDIAGEGDQKDDLVSLSKQLKVYDRLTFHGWVNSLTVTDLIRQSRALIFPSLWHEPGGTVAFEAMSNSRAVVMSKVGGMPEVVKDDVNGYLVKPGDVNGLAQCINKLAKDWHLAKSLGEMGREKSIHEFSISSHMSILMKIYEKTIAQFSQELSC